MLVWKCEYCDTENDAQDKECPNCGAPRKDVVPKFIPERPGDRCTVVTETPVYAVREGMSTLVHCVPGNYSFGRRKFDHSVGE